MLSSIESFQVRIASLQSYSCCCPSVFLSVWEAAVHQFPGGNEKDRGSLWLVLPLFFLHQVRIQLLQPSRSVCLLWLRLIYGKFKRQVRFLEIFYSLNRKTCKQKWTTVNYQNKVKLISNKWHLFIFLNELALSVVKVQTKLLLVASHPQSPSPTTPANQTVAFQRWHHQATPAPRVSLAPSSPMRGGEGRKERCEHTNTLCPILSYHCPVYLWTTFPIFHLCFPASGQRWRDVCQFLFVQEEEEGVEVRQEVMWQAW